MLPNNLSASELRVLGSLIEKQLSTPEHYPLSMNSLVAACNQSTNRDPVTSLTQQDVSASIDTLRRQSLVRAFQGSGERVPKYQHLLQEAGELADPEIAVLCVLMLRGPQTMAEVRTRASRLLLIENAEAFELAASSLANRGEQPLVVSLPRRPGQKEVRYAHTLSTEEHALHQDAGAATAEEIAVPAVAGSAIERVNALEEQVNSLRDEIAALRAEITELRRLLE